MRANNKGKSGNSTNTIKPSKTTNTNVISEFAEEGNNSLAKQDQNNFDFESEFSEFNEPVQSDSTSTSTSTATVSIESKEVSVNPVPVIVPVAVELEETVDQTVEKNRIKDGELTLKKLEKEGFEVEGITGDMIIQRWTDLLHTTSIDKSYVSKVLKAITNYGFEEPRNIQMLSILRILRGGDLIAQASAGNGKTGAFAIPCILSTNPNLKEIQKIIIAPTTVLSDQIFTVFTELSRGTGLIIQNWCGGSKYYHDKRPHIVVGTPGRIVDMIESNCYKDGTKRKPSDCIDLRYLTSLILDEGDELLGIGFKDQLKTIITSCPNEIQVCVFSATFPVQIINICKSFMKDYSVLIVPESKVITTRVNQWYTVCNDEDNKVSDIIDCINKNQYATIMIFCNSCSGIDRLRNALTAKAGHIKHLYVSGKLPADDRKKAISDFISGKCRILLSSDIGARGFDFTDVSIVINYNMPNSVETYIHRIGRAGRAGTIGNSLSLISTDTEMSDMKHIVQFHRMPIIETNNKKKKDGSNMVKFIFT